LTPASGNPPSGGEEGPGPQTRNRAGAAPETPYTPASTTVALSQEAICCDHRQNPPKAMRDIDDEAGKNDWVRAIIDVPGVGGGVVDRLAELDLPVVPYNGGESPIDKERFVNARAEDYWTLRERFEQAEIDIDPDDDTLAAQLGSIKGGIDSRGRIKIESKDDMRKRGLPSPDRADAMAIAFAGRANSAPMNVESHSGECITGI
jgi:hypothetical protein